MTYRDLFKVLEHFNLLDTHVNSLEECQDCNGDTLFVITYINMPEFSKDICINVSTGEITLTDMEVDPESELGDMMPTFEKKMSLEDIKDWG